MNVEDNIRSVLEVVEPNRRKREHELDALLDEFSITHLRKSPSIALSGGERRRCEIARALASRPAFMLLDEPFAGIDPIAVGDIQVLVRHLTKRGIGVLPASLLEALKRMLPRAQFTLDKAAKRLMVVASPAEHEIVQKALDEAKEAGPDEPKLRFYQLEQEPPADLVEGLQKLVPDAEVRFTIRPPGSRCGSATRIRWSWAR